MQFLIWSCEVQNSGRAFKDQDAMTEKMPFLTQQAAWHTSCCAVSGSTKR